MEIQSNNQGLYALCMNDDQTKIKIGKISGTINDLMNQYSTRYNSQGYKLLRYWNGAEFYVIETKVHTHPILMQCRIYNSITGRLTEWFATTLEIIDEVVSTTIAEHRNTLTKAKNIQYITLTITKSSQDFSNDIVTNKINESIPNEIHKSLESIPDETINQSMNPNNVVVTKLPINIDTNIFISLNITKEQPRANHLIFFDEVFMHGIYPIPRNMIFIDNHNNLPFIAANELFNLYCEWCKQNGSIYTIRSTGFCREIYKYPGLLSAGRRSIDDLRPRCVYITKYDETTNVIDITESETVTYKLSTLILNN